MSLFKKLREVEWIWSLWRMVAEHSLTTSIFAVVIAMLTAAATTIYSLASWINQFGAAGWIIAGVAAFFTCTLVTGVFAWTWHSIRTVRAGRKVASSESAAARAERERNTDEAIRRIERSVFLLLVNATDEATHRALWKALRTLPDDETGDDDETLLRIKLRLEQHEGQTMQALSRTRWSNDFDSRMVEKQRQVDVALRSATFPHGINPQIHREYTIAREKRAEIESFLINAISESDYSRDQTADMLREQKALTANN